MKSWSDQEEYAGGGEYVTEALQRVRRPGKGEGNMEKDVREHTEEKAGCQGAGEGTEDWKEKEKQQYRAG